MTAVRPASETIACVDTDSAAYRDLVADVRGFDHVTRLHLSSISDVAWKSLPAISRVVGTNSQALQHFIAHADGNVTYMRQRRLQLARQELHGWSFVLCLDETGDHKYGTITDDVSRQYIGSLGTIETGLVSVRTACLTRSHVPCCFRSSSRIVA